MELTRIFTAEQFEQALAPWRWIGLDGLEPWFASTFGDVFLTGDDGIYWLDVAAGELTRPWTSAEEAKAALGTDEGLDEYLLADLAFAAAEAELEPAGDEVLDFKTPPVLGGEYDVANLRLAGFVAAVSEAGRLHDRIKDLPEGAEIDL